MTTTFLHSLVSKQKRRFQEDGFDLDLSYVTDNIIAMGFPSDDGERFYRNPYTEVIRFLDKRHKDKFKIYNLCSERGYDPEKFYNRVGTFPFDDHNAPRFELIEELCSDIKEFLSIDPENVAVIHCKAGKGRTGLMICCWLLYNKEWPTADAAQQFYAAMRTKNQKGVTIPSQIRYINYFEERMKADKWDPDYQAIGLKTIKLNGVPKIPHSSELKMTLFMDKKPFYPWKPSEQEKENYRKAKKGKGGKVEPFVIDCGNYPVIRDVKVQFDEKKLTSQEILCTFWFNTWFIRGNHLHLEQPEIDRANKDKKKIFPEGFSIDVEFDADITNNTKPEDDDSDGYDENKGYEPEEEEEEKKNFGRSGTLVIEEEDGEPVQISSKVAEPLNMRGGTFSGEPRHACAVAIDLLDQAIALYKHCLPKNATSLMDCYVPKRNGDHEKEMFQAFETATSELNQVSLDKLSEDDLTVFWLNTLNLMYLHSFVIFGPPNQAATREKILEKANYSVAGLVYPLIVVEQVVILGNLGKPPAEIGGMKLPKIKLKEKDSRKTYQLKNPSKLVYFGISGGAKCLPFLFVFRSPETLENDLKMLVKVAFSEVHVKAEIIHQVPVYLSWYKKNFAKKEAEMVGSLAGIAEVELAENKGAVQYKKVDWSFDSFFLHFQKDIPLEEALKNFREDKQQATKEQNKADFLQKMDDIDELEEIENDQPPSPKGNTPNRLAASSPNLLNDSPSDSSAPNSARGSSSSAIKGGGSKKKLKKSTSRKFKSIAGSKTPDSPSGEKRNRNDTEPAPVKEKKEKKKKGSSKEKKEEERVIPPPPTDFVPPPEGESSQ